MNTTKTKIKEDLAYNALLDLELELDAPDGEKIAALRFELRSIISRAIAKEKGIDPDANPFA